MPYLTWISDKSLFAATKKLLKHTRDAANKSNGNLRKNVMDPFSAIFQMAGFKMTYDQWLESEKSRQAQKTMQNFVGEFHQEILGSCTGWKNMGTGNVIDLSNKRKRIVAEIKNKHNTISGGLLSDLYGSLEDLVMPKSSTYYGFTAYYVSIIPKKPNPFNSPFTPSNRKSGKKRPINHQIRIIDGKSFYELVTNDENALKDLFTVLPKIIVDIDKKRTSKADIKNLNEIFDLAFG